MTKFEKQFLNHINYGKFEDLVFDYMSKVVPVSRKDTGHTHTLKVLTFIAYIENWLLELGAEQALMLIFEFRDWLSDNAPTYLSIAEYEKTKAKYENLQVFISEHGVLIFEEGN